jgi:uncharacterized protein YndB with AHSA1/START domain
MEKTAPMITVKATVNVPVDKAWTVWSDPQHIIQWSNASDDWHTTYAENDLQPGGKFLSHMAAKDKSFEFDFGGTYDAVRKNELIEYTMGDGRKVTVTFSSNGQQTDITEIFEPESQNPVEMQQTGWQNILNNFKKYAENN